MRYAIRLLGVDLFLKKGSSDVMVKPNGEIKDLSFCFERREFNCIDNFPNETNYVFYLLAHLVAEEYKRSEYASVDLFSLVGDFSPTKGFEEQSTFGTTVIVGCKKRTLDRLVDTLCCPEHEPVNLYSKEGLDYMKDAVYQDGAIVIMAGRICYRNALLPAAIKLEHARRHFAKEHGLAYKTKTDQLDVHKKLMTMAGFSAESKGTRTRSAVAFAYSIKGSVKGSVFVKNQSTNILSHIGAGAELKRKFFVARIDADIDKAFFIDLNESIVGVELRYVLNGFEAAWSKAYVVGIDIDLEAES